MLLFAKDWERLEEPRACFVVVHRSPLRLRRTATMKETDCTGMYLRPGQCFTVAEMKQDDTDPSGIRYLKLSNGSGWVFDRLGSQRVVSELGELELGEWWYTITTPDFGAVRVSPSTSDECRSGWIMCPKEVTVVGLRCMILGHKFLQLLDVRGWLFYILPGTVGLESSMTQIMRECSANERSALNDAEKISCGGGENRETTAIRTLTQDLGIVSLESDETMQQASSSASRLLQRVRCFGLCGRSSAVAP
jgi:hypothetical protein